MRFRGGGTLTDSECLVYDHWPKKLIRQGRGCDFIELETGSPCEVKSRVLRVSQMVEMIEAKQSGKSPKLVLVQGRTVLVFELAAIIGIQFHRPDEQPPEIEGLYWKG